MVKTKTRTKTIVAIGLVTVAAGSLAFGFYYYGARILKNQIFSTGSPTSTSSGGGVTTSPYATLEGTASCVSPVVTVGTIELFASGKLISALGGNTSQVRAYVKNKQTDEMLCDSGWVSGIRVNCHISINGQFVGVNTAILNVADKNIGVRGKIDTGIPYNSGCSSNAPLKPPCAPNCAGKQCGDSGCGGSCGICSSGQTCQSGKCVASLSCPYARFIKKGSTQRDEFKVCKDDPIYQGRTWFKVLIRNSAGLEKTLYTFSLADAPYHECYGIGFRWTVPQDVADGCYTLLHAFGPEPLGIYKQQTVYIGNTISSSATVNCTVAGGLTYTAYGQREGDNYKTRATVSGAKNCDSGWVNEKNAKCSLDRIAASAKIFQDPLTKEEKLSVQGVGMDPPCKEIVGMKQN